MAAEGLKLTGTYVLKHTDLKGKVATQRGSNLVTDVGINHFTIRSVDGDTGMGPIAEMALGSDGTAPVNTALALGAEIAASRTQNTLTSFPRFVTAGVTFTAVAVWDVREVGLFASLPPAAPPGGQNVMVARFTIQNVLMQVTETLDITWRLLFGGAS